MSIRIWWINFITLATVVSLLCAIIYNKEEEIQRLRYQKFVFHFQKPCPVCNFPVEFNEAISPVRD